MDSTVERLKKQIDKIAAERRAFLTKVNNLALEALDMMSLERGELYKEIERLKAQLQEKEDASEEGLEGRSHLPTPGAGEEAKIRTGVEGGTIEVNGDRSSKGSD